MAKYVCSICGYVYDEEAGAPDQEFPQEQSGKMYPTILFAPHAE